MENLPREKVALTKSLIDKLPFAPEGKQATVYDKNLPGFALRIGAKAKTFIVYKRLANGTPKRVTLGRYGHLTVDQARNLAQQELAKLTQGIDPNFIKKEQREEAKKVETFTAETLGWLLDLYETEHIKGNKGGSEATLKDLKIVRDYFGERTITLLREENGRWKEDKNILLPDWLNRPYRSITKHEVLERFDYFASAKPSRIPKEGLRPIQRTHQVAFKFLNSAYNFILPRTDLSENFVNPCDVLKAYKRWRKTEPRTRRVVFEKKEGANWFNVLQDYASQNPVASDYLLFSLIQAGRSIELAKLTWDKIDFELKTISYTDTKNKEAYIFPVTKLAIEILERRQEDKINEFVFGYPDGRKYGHITPSAKPHFKNIAEKCGVLISHHDLRRTWASTAHKLQIDERTINLCLKHKMNDVNVHYIERNLDTMLRALQKTENYFVEQAEKWKAADLPNAA
jgi:hypothetical protein